MKLTKKLRFLFSLTALLVCMCMSTVAVNADTLGDYAVETTTSADSLKTYAGGKISLADAKTLVQNYVSLVQQLSTMTESEREYVEENYSSQPQTVAIIQAYNKSVDTEKYGAFVSSKDDVKVVENKDEDGTDAVDVTVTLAFEKKDAEKMSPIVEQITKWEKFSDTEKRFYVNVDSDKDNTRSVIFENGYSTCGEYKRFFSNKELDFTTF